nr:RNA-directed DNA polymerase, eukaryota, reverse transcriptase zinc-binding domain protein [Tanacetum cinerariifolium]
KFHANIARFHRAPLNNNKVSTEQKFGYNRNNNNIRAKEGVTTGSSKSYVHAVKVKNMFGALECDSMPSIVVDDECLISKDLSKALLGRVKDFASLPNLKIVLKNEGFVEIKIQYMGEFWVLLEFPSSKTKDLFQENMRVGSWFSVLKQTSSDFIPEGRIVWVEIEGRGRLCIHSKSGTNIYENFKVIFRGKAIRAKEVHGWVPEFVDDSDDDDEEPDNGFKDGDVEVQDGGRCENDSDEVEVSETVFEESLEQKVNQSEDPFGIYLLLNKNKDKSENMKPSGHSLKYPSGFTPNGDNNEFCMRGENVRSVNEANLLNCNMKENQNGQERNSTNKGSKEEILGSVYSAFDFVHSDSVGNSGGILCIWDLNSFRKNNVTVSDYFCMVWGVWLKTGVDIRMVVVYAPQELRDKRILWDYLEHVINQWDGEVVIMGDFNEIRFKSERFGSVFSVQGANVFNTFIANAGLEEVPLGGSSFTWCHKFATKISKLDRKIWEWVNDNKNKSKSVSDELKEELQKLDADIDKGIGSDDIINKRLEVLNSIHHLDKIKAMDMAQKAKIKWAIEGDENTRYFHGVLNKKGVN